MAKKPKSNGGVRCDVCKTLWHSSQRNEGDVCNEKIGKKLCKGICKKE